MEPMEPKCSITRSLQGRGRGWVEKEGVLQQKGAQCGVGQTADIQSRRYSKPSWQALLPRVHCTRGHRARPLGRAGEGPLLPGLYPGLLRSLMQSLGLPSRGAWRWNAGRGRAASGQNLCHSSWGATSWWPSRSRGLSEGPQPPPSGALCRPGGPGFAGWPGRLTEAKDRHLSPADVPGLWGLSPQHSHLFFHKINFSGLLWGRVCVSQDPSPPSGTYLLSDTPGCQRFEQPPCLWSWGLGCSEEDTTTWLGFPPSALYAHFQQGIGV